MTTVVNFALLLLYLVISTYGLIRIKAAGIGPTSDFALGFGAYAAGFLIWLYILDRLPLSIAFPVAAGGLVVATQIGGSVVLGEKISWQQGIGVALILCGISLIYTRTQ